MKRATLSVCILAKNEALHLPRALESVRQVADEVIVVDTGSTDETVAVAESYGAKVVHHTWNDDFAAARNVGIDQATGDWVLMLDADEAVSRTMAVRLPKLLADPHADAYITQVANILEGQAVNHIPAIRLFRRKPAYRFTGMIHEQIIRSIESAGGRIKTEPVVIEHFGYTPEEDQRKARRDRNLRLLRKMVEEHPESHDHWSHLGHEYALLHEYGQAEACLRRAIELNPFSLQSVHAAHRLVRIGLRRRRLEQGWQLASMGHSSPFSRWDSDCHRVQVALYEGDHVAAEQVLRRLKGAPSGDFRTFERSEARLAGWQAEALWLKGQRQAALAEWERAVEAHPADLALAEEWMHHKTLAEGLPKALAAGRALVSRCPALFVGMTGALLRAGEFSLAVVLAREGMDFGYSACFLYALAQAGDWSSAVAAARGQGLDGAVHLATAGAWFGNEAALTEGLERLPDSWRSAFRAVLAGEQVDPHLQWAVDLLMNHWADVGCWSLLRAGAKSLGESGGPGRAAWLLWHSHQPRTALQWALEKPEHPDALEVLGLAAAEQGDHQAAAQFLADRISLGPARVAVYACAARALTALGERGVARAVRELGLEQHPWSPLLKQT
ncbi:glycosyltransferase [Symbiobacterium thermophilum]|uniref:Glycosyltransferase 2-like domain-containing protein n=1 Tax=Symbiobacterium thermophilum TaxID=2734 RepID=A0A953I7D8_SYMTR|nr:glycosyltransferase [Symbiobacterium thermophilum]MBY6275658.1 hypothetical protein [Symbiobacterium thermophilum]